MTKKTPLEPEIPTGKNKENTIFMVTLNGVAVKQWKGNEMRGKSINKHGQFITCDKCNEPPKERDEGRLTYMAGKFLCCDCLIDKPEKEDIREARENVLCLCGPQSGISRFRDE